MDFLRRLFRGQQRDEEAFLDAQSMGVPDQVTAANTALSADQAEFAGDQNGSESGQSDQSGYHSDLQGGTDDPAWWEDSQPLVEAALQEDPALVVSRSDEPMPTQSDTPTAPLGRSNEPLPAQSDAPTEPLAALRHQNDTDERTIITVYDLEEVGTHTLTTDSVPALSTQPSLRGLAVSALRDVGRVRTINQDSVFTLVTALPREGTDTPLGLFVVADGMGGHDGGEIASRLAIRTVAHEIISQLVMPALDDSLTEALQPLMITAVQAANRVIWDHAQSVGSDMGTTCTAVLLLGHALYIAHVGDTRAYLLEAGVLRTLTDDHSAVGRLIQLGQFDPAEAREHPLRSQLYRTVGQQPQVQVDFIYHRLNESSHLLVCSDGLWGMIADDQIQQTLLRYTWPQDACHELIALANLAGGEDNISAIVVSLPSAERPL